MLSVVRIRSRLWALCVSLLLGFPAAETAPHGAPQGYSSDSDSIGVT